MIPKNDSHKESFLFFSRLFQGARICRCSFFLIRFFYQEFRHFYRENSIAARRTNARIPPPYPLLLAFVRCRILRNCVSNFVQNGFALNLEYTTKRYFPNLKAQNQVQTVRQLKPSDFKQKSLGQF